MKSRIPATVLACDYDETLAAAGRVTGRALKALARFQASGGKFVLVTGRALEDLAEVAPELTCFDFVVAENGAVLYWPQSRHVQAAASGPPDEFIAELAQRGVHPLAIGRSIVATVRQHAPVVRQIIAEMGLELETILNRSSLMILPRGVNKGTGLTLALQHLGWPAENVIGIGDAENDASFLSICGTSVAVANAIPAIKEAADWTTDHECGDGIVEVINRVLAGDICATRSTPSR
jgi:phosphoglycolate phosphatase (TIGR01487 family)